MNTHVGRLANRFERPGIIAADRRSGTDPGHEPALDGFGGGGDVDRRGVSLRWLGASVLTALTGAALIGSAIYVALQGETTFAELPEHVTAQAPRGPGEDKATAARKGDKLVRSEVVAVAKQAFRAPVTIRVGDREVIKVRPFVRIATNLSLTSGLYATDIPPFNPLRLFSEENNEKVIAEAAPEVADAEVSVVKRDLAAATVEPSPAGLSDEDVAAQIEEERRTAAEAGRRPALPLPAQLLLSRTLRQPDALPDALGFGKPIESPFNSIEVRVIPENVTTLPKLEPRAADSLFEERDVALKRNEGFEAALKANGATEAQIGGIVNALGGRPKTAALVEGQRMRILVGPGLRPGEPRQIMRVILFGERGVEAIAAMNDRSAFVSVTPPVEESAGQEDGRRPNADGEDSDAEEGGVAALRQPLRDGAEERAAAADGRGAGADLRLRRRLPAPRVATGDTFEIFYGQDEDGAAERPEVLYAALTVGGEAGGSIATRATTARVDFFDEAGRSLRKFLIRKPIAEGILRSGFGYRRHPMLGYSKMHTGVDWANRIGTPIMAAGNGTVIKAEWEFGLRPPGRGPARQRLRDLLQPHVALRPRHRAGGQGAPGPGHRLCRLDRPLDRAAPPLRGHRQRPLRRPDEDPRAARKASSTGRALAEFKRQRDQTDGLMQKAGASTRLAQRGDAPLRPACPSGPICFLRSSCRSSA